MRKNTPADELKKDYHPEEIGQRILELIRQENMTLKGFQIALGYFTVPPFNNLRKFLSAKEVREFDRGWLQDELVYKPLGDFFLDFAYTAYIIALVLRTDTEYLALGQENRRFGKIYPAKGMETDQDLGEKLLKINPVDISRRIKSSRNIDGTNSREIAKATKVSLATYLGYENADTDYPHRFSFPVFRKICDELNIEPDYIMLGESIVSVYNLGNEYNTTNVLASLKHNISEVYMDEIDEHWMNDSRKLDDLDIEHEWADDFYGKFREKLKMLSGKDRSVLLKKAFERDEESARKEAVELCMIALNAVLERIRQSMDTWTAEDLVTVWELANDWHSQSFGTVEMGGPFKVSDYGNIPAKLAMEVSHWLKDNLTKLPVYALCEIDNLLHLA